MSKWDDQEEVRTVGEGKERHIFIRNILIEGDIKVLSRDKALGKFPGIMFSLLLKSRAPVMG